MVCQELQVSQVQLDHPDGREIQERLDLQEHPVLWELQEPQEALVLMVFQDPQVFQELQDTQEEVVCQVFPDHLDHQEHQEAQDQHQSDITVQ